MVATYMMWSLEHNGSLVLGHIAFTRRDVQSAVSRNLKLPWKALRKQGWRAVKIFVSTAR